MEIAMSGKDWWRVERSTKHLIASTAKKIYEPYWNDYFKFSFVRNPWDRMVSLGRFSKFYGVNLGDHSINLSKYFKKFPHIEIDPRSKSKHDKFDPIKNSVFLNILNVELDFIGRFENINEDFEFVYESIGEVPTLLTNRRRERSSHKHYTEYYNEETKQIVAKKFAKDIDYFGYEFGR